MMEWIKSYEALYSDPYMWLFFGPLIFGVVYIVVSFFGERG